MKLAVAFWILQWAARTLANYAGHHWRAAGPPPIESAQPPGWMPGPNQL